jgi:class 3 adenylate cyclase
MILFRRPVHLSTALALIFAALTIPALIAILVVAHWRNSVAINRILYSAIHQERRDTERLVDDLVRPVVTTLALLAEYAADDPSFFSEQAGVSTLFRGLDNLQQIQSLQVSYQDGHYRSITRVGDANFNDGSKIPAEAKWVVTTAFDPTVEIEPRTAERSFVSKWPSVLGTEQVSLAIAPRNLPIYVKAEELNRESFAPPWFNADTGDVVVSIGYPIRHNGVFKGIIGADITFAELSRFLHDNRVSERSSTLIIGSAGSVVAISDYGQNPRTVTIPRKLQYLDEVISPSIRTAISQGTTPTQNILTRVEQTEYGEASVLFFDIESAYDLGLRALIVTPVDDFVGPLKQTNHIIILFISALILLDWILIRRLSHALSRGIESISHDCASLQALEFKENRPHRSFIEEVAQVQRGVTLLRNTLGSFSRFVPMGVVRQLVDSGQPLTLGVETKQLTILFCDLENFTSHAEKLPPDRLLDQISAYFSMVTEAVAQEQGTVDKFIGDAVMAFWGAPIELEDHALSACKSAIRILRGMDRLNKIWREQGKPALGIRIGINTAEVLVGNIGSHDRLSYTAIGDGVNIASRLQSVNKQFGSCICISDSVHAAVRSDVVVKPLGDVTVKGRSSKFPIYELLEIRGAGDPDPVAYN